MFDWVDTKVHASLGLISSYGRPFGSVNSWAVDQRELTDLRLIVVSNDTTEYEYKYFICINR